MTTHPSSPQPSAARSTPTLRPGRRQRLLQHGLGLMLLASLHACGGSSVDDPASPDGNTAPVARIADIASPQSVGQAIALSGTPSSDADGDALSYRWSLGAAPGGSSPTIADPQAQTTTLRTDLPGDYQVVLLVNDGSTDSGSAVAAFTLTNTASSSRV